MNDLLGSDTTEEGKLVYVSDTLLQQAVDNSKEQFSNSLNLAHELLNAIMDASSALSSLSGQALESEKVRRGLKDVLLGPAQLGTPSEGREFSDDGSLARQGTLRRR